MKDCNNSGTAWQDLSICNCSFLHAGGLSCKEIDDIHLQFIWDNKIPHSLLAPSPGCVQNQLLHTGLTSWPNNGVPCFPSTNTNLLIGPQLTSIDIQETVLVTWLHSDVPFAKGSRPAKKRAHFCLIKILSFLVLMQSSWWSCLRYAPTTLFHGVPKKARDTQLYTSSLFQGLISLGHFWFVNPETKDAREKQKPAESVLFLKMLVCHH